MIFGNQSKGTIIAAQNMLGYDSFVDGDFIKPFKENEPLEILYPPDHPNSGSKYVFDTPLGNDTLGVFSFEWGRKTHQDFPETQGLEVNKDYVLPYQSEIDIVFTSSLNSGMRPLTDRAITADNGNDAFFLKGSVIRGKVSGAKRFYAGPFKGFTKEIQGVCQGATSVNLMDGSDCAGYLKGSFYEHGYEPKTHNLFMYSDQAQTRVDVNGAINHYFMEGTPYNNLSYNWMNVRDRFKRPVPYSILSDTGKGVAAMLITSRHALVSADADIDSQNLRFDCGGSGIVSPTVLTTASTFKQMWDAIGFIDENKDAETLAAFNDLKQYFDGIKIITFTEDLPIDSSPIRLIDMFKSDPIFYGLAIGNDGRGHHGTFCPPTNSGASFDPSNLPTLLFKESQKCSQMQSQEKHEMQFVPRTVSVVNADIGSPVITYYKDMPVLLGVISDGDHSDGTAYASFKGMGLGSTKEIDFPWGASFSPISFLNLYLSVHNAQVGVQSVSTVRYGIDTSETYPYPDVPFEQGTPSFRMVRGDTGLGVNLDDTEGLSGIVAGVTACVSSVIGGIIGCAKDAAERVYCECQGYADEGDYIRLYFCVDKACDIIRKFNRLLGIYLPFKCPKTEDEWKRLLSVWAVNVLGKAISGCPAYFAIQEGFFDYCNELKHLPCTRKNQLGIKEDVPPPPDTPPLTQECISLLERTCGLERQVLDKEGQRYLDYYNRLLGCMYGKLINEPELFEAKNGHRYVLAECSRAECPPGGFNGTKCSVSCSELYRYFLTGEMPENCRKVSEFPTEDPRGGG